MAAPLWIDKNLPGVSHMPSSRRVALRKTGEKICTAHSFESKGYKLTAEAGARYLISQASEAHLVVNLVHGTICQLLPANVGARTLRAPSGLHTNAHGSRHIQIEFIGDAARPFTGDLTAAGRRALGYVLDFTRANGVPDRWVGGVRPPKYPGPGVTRFMPKSGESGWTHHAAWRGNDHGDPGAILDPWALVDPTPAPRPAPTLDAYGRYRVRSGDTLGAIASRYRTSVDALVLLNGISNPDRIDVGDMLYTRWVVGRGDTLGEIADAVGTSVDRLVVLNGIRNPDAINVGQLLRLP